MGCPARESISVALQLLQPWSILGTHADNTVCHVRCTTLRIRSDLFATLFFSHSEEYDGGELIIEDPYGIHSVKLPAGHMVLYP